MELDEIKKWLIPGVITIAVGLTSYITMKIYLSRRRYAHIPGPEAKGITGFFMGNVLDFKEAAEKNSILDLFNEWY
jgi:hypothetical protein